jgi:hypothetical protein
LRAAERGGVTVRSSVLTLAALLAVTSVAWGLQVWNRVVINEVHYYMPGFDAHNEYVELLNAGGSVAFLDGAVITDEGDEGMPEAVFRFPGVPGGFDLPLMPGETLLIAVDAVVGEIEPDLSGADWEFVHPGDDNDNPDVPNLLHVGGSNCDIALANAGDGLLLATGEDTTAAIDCATIVDGVNWGDADDPVPISWLDCVDPDHAEGVPQGNSLGRCHPGLDSNTSSASDWFMMLPTPDSPNSPSYPSDCATGVHAPPSWGAIKALYRAGS